MEGRWARESAYPLESSAGQFVHAPWLPPLFSRVPSTNGVTNTRMEDGCIRLFVVVIRGWLVSEPPPVLPQIRQQSLGCEVKFECRIWGRGMSGWDANGWEVIGCFLWKENRPVESSHGATLLLATIVFFHIPSADRSKTTQCHLISPHPRRDNASQHAPTIIF